MSASSFALGITLAFHSPVAIVPTDVSEEASTVDFKVLPLSVPAAAVTVIAAEPSKFTPLIALGVVNVAADPVVLALITANLSLIAADVIM